MSSSVLGREQRSHHAGRFLSAPWLVASALVLHVNDVRNEFDAKALITTTGVHRIG